MRAVPDVHDCFIGTSSCRPPPKPTGYKPGAPVYCGVAMPERRPFVLLDDASGRSDARALLFEKPSAVFVAQKAGDVEPVLEQAHQTLQQAGGGAQLAGYLAYEAGLALEPRLAPRADDRSGGMGPLVWLALFDDAAALKASEVEEWLAAEGKPENSDLALPATLGPLYPQLSYAAYRRQVGTLNRSIRAGDIYQANLTFPLAGGFTGAPIDLYRALRRAGGAAHGAIVFDGSHWLLSLSPELFFEARAGRLRVRPMKGTRPRGSGKIEDRRLRDELAGSEKDRAENLMIADLMRNDLSRIATPASVRVTDPFAIETYPTVHQMVTGVEAQLDEDRTPLDLLRALFPCGSITGTPKIRAMELLDGMERDARGPYCGAIGHIGAKGDAAFNVAIRTLRLTEVENGRGKAVLGVGSAILADADASAEWRECLIKGRFASHSSPGCTAPGFDLFETMRFEPDEGIALLERHLARMKDSAAALGFTFDRHETRNQIQALCFSLDATCRVRLSLSRGGAIALEADRIDAEWPEPAMVIALPMPVDPGDWRLRHKSSDRWFYEAGLVEAQAAGAADAVFVRDDGLVTEGCRSTIFVPDAEGRLRTPPLSLGLLPGVLRAQLLEDGSAYESELTLAELAGGFSIGNALRGMGRAQLLS